MIPKAAGCYEIFNTTNGHRYIGQSVNLYARKVDHFKFLRGAKHHNAHLQNAWNKYGESAFVFRVVLLCAPTKRMLCFYEQQLIDKVGPEYNKAKIAGTPLGVKRSAETIAKIRKALTGRKQSPETVALRAARLKGNSNTLGHTLSPEHRAKISTALRGRVGKRHSTETRAKISSIQKGIPKAPFTAAHRANLSRAAFARYAVQ